MDELDDDLRRRISEVFENFDEPSADEGWLLLRQKYPEKEKNRGIIWLWTGIAAAVLLLLGIGLYLFNDHTQSAQTQIAAKHQVHKNLPEPNQTLTQADSDRQSLASAPALKLDSGSVKHDTKPGNAASATQPAVKSQYAAIAAAKSNDVKIAAPMPGKNNNTKLPVTASGQSLAQNNAAQKAIQQGNGKPDAGLKNTIANSDQPDNGKSASDQQPVIAMSQPPANQSKVDANNSQNEAKTVAASETPKKQPRSIFDDPDKANAMAYKDVDKKPMSKAVHFGIYATTYFNYAKGSSNQVNVGAGLSSDIRLAGRLKLSTGLAVTQNSLYYGSQPTIPTVAAAAAPQAQSLTFAVSSNAASFFSVNNSPSFRNYNASMVNLDVPVNLKYDLGNGKHGFFVAAGVSSGTFINETYIYNYNTPGLFNATEQASSKSQTNTQNFSNFYLARVLNMSFGVGFPMGNGNHLSVEPFVKYPLQGLGAEQIKFGSGGVNLKFNFSTFKR